MASTLNGSSDTPFPLPSPSSKTGAAIHTRPNLKHAPLSNTIAEKGHPHRSRPSSPSPPASPTSSTRAGLRDSSLNGMGRAFVLRCLRMARRGNLAFLIVFLSCLVIFFSALAGVGYVDPDAALLSSASAFVPGAPVFHARADQADLARVSMLEDQKELETLWQRKKRPKDGAWMQIQRDDKAVRRIKPVVQPEVEVIPYEESLEVHLVEEREGVEERPMERR